MVLLHTAHYLLSIVTAPYHSPCSFSHYPCHPTPSTAASIGAGSRQSSRVSSTPRMLGLRLEGDILDAGLAALGWELSFESRGALVVGHGVGGGHPNLCATLGQ